MIHLATEALEHPVLQTVEDVEEKVRNDFYKLLSTFVLISLMQPQNWIKPILTI